MEGERDGASGGIRAPVRPALHVGIAGLLLGPGVSKFFTYGQSVRFFRALALSAPGVVGAVEIGTAVLLLLDRPPRASAVTAVPVMIVALVTASPTWENFGVLLAAFVAIDTKIRGVSIAESTT